MIHSTKRDHYWSFWYQGGSKHHNQEVFWWNRAVEIVEASEVAETNKVDKAAEISITEDFTSRFLNLLYFDILQKKMVQSKVEFQQFFWLSVLKPEYVTFLKNGQWNSNFSISVSQNHIKTNFTLHISIFQSQFENNKFQYETPCSL